MQNKAERPLALSPRQAEIADLVKRGKTSRQVGEALNIDPRTVDSHIDTICNKLGVRTRVELVVALFGPSAGTEPAPTDTPKTNLPLARTSLVGRETDVADIVRTLGESRLVTVTGAGGVGKTRTALAAGEVVTDGMTAGVWLVELAPLATGADVATAIGQAIGIQEAPNRPLPGALITYLKRKALLLILDNCEHVIAQAALVVDALLRGCPQLQILATSREPLRIAGEQIYRLPSLRVPSASHAVRLSAQAATKYPAVVLFVQRARARHRSFALSDDTAPSIAEICRRLDGIPLAIELAAARVDILPVRVLLQKLNRLFQILTSGDRTALPRHQTMRALIDWSYDLLSPAEQRLFERLSIFAGSCDLAAMTAVYDNAADEPDVFALISSLVDKSLVVADVVHSEPRYSLLESSRHYAAEKLAMRGEATIVAHRHAVTYSLRAEELEHAFDRCSDAAWDAQVDLEIENWLAALDWALMRRGDIVLGQRLAGALRPVWQGFSLAEGRRWVRMALDLVHDETPAQVAADLEYAAVVLVHAFGEWEAAIVDSRRLIATYRKLGDSLGIARAQLVAGKSLLILGRVSEGEPLIQSSLDGARALGSLRLVGRALEGIAGCCSVAGKSSQARAHLGEAVAIYTAIGSECSAASAGINLAEAEFLAGNVEQALAIVTASLVVARKFGAGCAAEALLNVSAYLIASNRCAEAYAHCHDALDVAQETGREAIIAHALQHLAAINAFGTIESPKARKTPDLAARLIGYVDARILALGSSREYAEHAEYDRVMKFLRQVIGVNELTSLMAEGAAMTQDQAINVGRSF